MNKQTLIIIGAGGHGKVCLDVAIKMNKWNNIFFIDDHMSGDILGYPIIGSITKISEYASSADFFVSIGDNFCRAQLIKLIISNGGSLATLIHPTAILALDVSIGAGTVVLANTVLNSSVSVGIGCIINTASCIEHDCKVNNYVHISPAVSIAGSTTIGEYSWLGIGCIIINNITISENVIIGAGCVVIHNIYKSSKYVGIPAKEVVK